MIMAGYGAGALLGAICTGILGNLKQKGILALLMLPIMSVFLGLIPFFGPWGAVLCMLLAGTANSISNILFITIFQFKIPRHLMGRVMSLLFFGSSGSYPLSVAAFGFLSNHFSPTILFPASNMVIVLIVLVSLLFRELREM
jgi:hypothetical protein